VTLCRLKVKRKYLQQPGGRISTYRAIVYYGQLFLSYKSSQKFWTPFVHGKSYSPTYIYIMGFGYILGDILGYILGDIFANSSGHPGDDFAAASGTMFLRGADVIKLPAK
jgi:hypothetical protein